MSDFESLLGHKHLECRKCFSQSTCSTVRVADNWQLENNPMAWGATDPRILVLGFSKGSRQSKSDAEFDAVPFAAFRPKLNAALKALKLMPEDDCMENHLSASEQDWAFGSVVRCSVGLVNGEGVVTKSGNVIPEVIKDANARELVAGCAEKFLKNLPPRLEVVVLLSNTTDYVDLCFEVIRSLHPEARRTSEVTYVTAGVTWVHIVHVGGPGINHQKNWMSGNTTLQGRKRLMAQRALAQLAV